MVRGSLTLENFLGQQATDSFSQKAAAYVKNVKAKYTVDNNRLVVHWALVGGTIQELVPTVLRAQSQYRSHYPVLAIHSGKRRIYDSKRKLLYCRVTHVERPV